jgi:hypothetical protein
MTLDWAMIAEAVQVRDGLAFVLAGGIDTVNTDRLPAALHGAVLIRLLLHRTEVERPHVIETRIIDEDGQQMANLHSHVQARPVEGLPLGWDVPVLIAFNIEDLPLPKASRYSIEILGEGIHLKSLNLRVLLKEQPPAQTVN